MKKILLFSLCAILMVSLSSCIGGFWSKRKVKKLVENFATAVSEKDKATIAQLYPDAANAESLALTYNDDSISVETQEQEDAFCVKVGNSVELFVEKDVASGEFVIKDSRGVFTYPSQKFNFATKTGWYDPKLTDAANAKRLADKGFVEYLAGKIASDIQNKVYAKAISETHMATHGATYEVDVRNDNDFDLPGDAYVATATLWGFDFDTYRQVKTNTKKEFSGNSIPSHGNCRYKIPGSIDFEYEEWTVDVKITMSHEQMLFQFMKPTGHEYADYLEVSKTRKGLSLNLTGSIATANDAVFILNGITGEGQTTFTSGGVRQERKLKFESYDKNSGRLVIKEYFSNGNYVGDFDGTWKNGTYIGVMTNKNSNQKVNFSLKE